MCAYLKMFGAHKKKYAASFLQINLLSEVKDDSHLVLPEYEYKSMDIFVDMSVYTFFSQLIVSVCERRK